MADAYARVAGRVAAVTVHQGCGLTNAMTGIAEAAKSRTPLVVLAAEATEPRSNFYVDQPALARAVGACRCAWTVRRGRRPRRRGRHAGGDHASHRAAEPAAGRAGRGGRGLDRLDRQDHAGRAARAPHPSRRTGPTSRPGRRAYGAQSGRCSWQGGAGGRSAPTCGTWPPGLAHCSRTRRSPRACSMATTGRSASRAVSPSPLAAELIAHADLIVGWGCALNMWTMRHGAADRARRHRRPGRRRPRTRSAPTGTLTFGVVGDIGRRRAPCSRPALPDAGAGYRTDDVRDRIRRRAARWRDVPYDDLDGRRADRPPHPDPRSTTSCPPSGSSRSTRATSWATRACSSPSATSTAFCFTQAFQSIGLGLATAIGAALARPDRLTVAALGDGGALMSAAELDTVTPARPRPAGRRLQRRRLRRRGAPLRTGRREPRHRHLPRHRHRRDRPRLRLPRRHGAEPHDLDEVRAWLDGAGRGRCSSTPRSADQEPSWWLEEAFRGH